MSNTPSSDAAAKAVEFNIVGNIAFAASKWAVGYFGNSFALIADAIESTIDIFSSIIVWLGIKTSSRPSDYNHPYGHGKLENFATIIVGILLIITAFGLIYQSIINIRTPHELPHSFVLLFLVLVIGIKEYFYQRTKKKSQETNSNALNADAWHHRSDAITSLAALIGVAIAIIMGKGYESADDYATIIASIIILYNSIIILRPAIGELTDEHLHDHIVEEARSITAQVNGVIYPEKCFARKYGANYIIDMRIVVAPHLSVSEGYAIAQAVKDSIKKQMPNIFDVLVLLLPADKVTPKKD